MFLNNSVNEKCYLLPEDGSIANQDILSLFDLPNLQKVYIKAYALNWDNLLSKIKEADTKGIEINILSDYVQARGRGSWDELANLHRSIKNGRILLTTAGCGSKSTGQIWHSKAMSFIFSDKDPINLDGSCNFSDSGFLQGNTIRIFSSKIYSDEFVKHFETHREWAMNNAQNKQIDYLIAHPVSAESIEISEENSELFNQLDDAMKVIRKYKIALLALTIIIICQWLVFCTPIFR